MSSRRRKPKGKQAKAGHKSHTGVPFKNVQTGAKTEGKATSLTTSLLGGVGDTARVTLRYVQFFTVAGTSGVLGKNTFRGNSVFDPDQSGTGAQPVWFDDYALFYNRYRVVGSRCSVLAQGTTNNSLPVLFGLCPQHATAALTAEGYLSQPYGMSAVASPGTTPAQLSLYISTAKVLGYPGGGVMGSDALSALVSTNPAHVWYWHVWSQPMDQATTLAGTMYVTIDYDVLFFDKNDGALDLIRQLKNARKLQLAAQEERREEKKDDGVARRESDEFVRIPKALLAAK
jgi:hypothetical protein